MTNTKTAIICKCLFLVLMTTLGFLLTYSVVWVLLDLPETWWAGLLLAGLSGLSSAGLFLWIAKGD